MRIKLIDYIENHKNRADVGTPFYRWLVAAYALHSDAELIISENKPLVSLVRVEGFALYGEFYIDEQNGWIDDITGDWINDQEDEND